ncbi:polyadenylate-binding protein-interacting protein 4 isoform X3 [Selaginella moellendorffii]|uniref:polyadenylate-binding protein-interacting protein 4 isoform X3 n=1 Tax=Selaginella moellendorffii TaxID=88036 RepID=UPI000D1CBC94|nr:polyadenylate-binding protein-interacting protein 4 isoform X3 [Selaginella moellendorffii]|eukprot:XP_024531843.1 polyadenylate-binding protein-interacting protein 4 isoform X3 [Selaginella moellendorffii]
MNHPRSFGSNGVGRRSPAHRSDAPNWRSGAGAPPVRSSSGLQNHVSSNSSSPPSTGRPSSAIEDEELRGGAHDVHGRLLYLTMCLVGQFVEVQLKDGSVFSGIFHTANMDKDFGVVLKMARLTKEAGGKSGKGDAVKQAARKPPTKSLIIYAKDLVQIDAKDVSLTGEYLPNGRSRENKNELLTDSFISQNRRDTERELKPWKPDSEAPRNLGLDTTFQNSWNRNWDQFETNKALFGVETTFDEELYTTKLEKGPQTREREREASRLAREIEGDSTRNNHLAEDRGVSDAELDTLDEESRFSSVLRSHTEGDGEDDHHKAANSWNEETFGSVSGSTESNVSTPTAVERPLQDSSQQVPATSSPRSSASASDAGLQALNLNTSVSEEVLRDFRDFKETTKKGKKDQVNELKHFSENFKERTVKDFDGRLPKSSSAAAKLSDDLRPGDAKPSLPTISPPPASALPIPVGLSSSSSGTNSVSSSRPRSPIKPAAPKASESPSPEIEADRPSTPAAPASAANNSATGNKKSLLNPNAKEFKLNPNAKVFTPSFPPARPASPINPSPIYVPAGVPVAPMQGMPVYMQQPGQPAQYTQYNNTMAATGVTTSPYIQPSATFIPGPAGPPIKLPPQTQAQVGASPYGQQQAIRYMPPTMQPTPAYPHPNYPQQVIYGQPPLVYIHQYPQAMMQGQPLQMQQGPLGPPSQLSQPQTGGEGLHSNVLVGQSPPLQSPLHSPVPRSQAVPVSVASSSGAWTG